MKKALSIKTYVCLLILALGVFPFAAQNAGAADKTIVIGNVADLTGSTAAVGVPTAAGQQAYFADLNEKGGILGYKVVSVLLDGEETITTETRQFNKLVTKEKALAIIGWGTPGTRALLPAATREGITYLGRTASSAAIAPEKYPFTFIPTPTYLDQIKVAMDFAKAKGGKDIVFVRDDIEAWKTTMRIIEDSKYAEKIGLNIKAVIVEPIKATDVTVQMMRVKALDPDFIITPNTADTLIPTLRDAAKVGIDTKKIIGATMWSVHEIIPKKLGKVADGYAAVQVYPIWGADNDIQKEINEYLRNHPDKMKEFEGSNFYIQGWMLGKAFAIALEKVLKNNNGKLPQDFQNFRKQFRDVYADLKGPIFGKGLPSVDNSDHKLIGHAFLAKLENGKYIKASEYLEIK